MDAKADLSLQWVHVPFCWFCHEAAHFICQPHSLFYVFLFSPERKAGMSVSVPVADQEAGHRLHRHHGHPVGVVDHHGVRRQARVAVPTRTTCTEI